MHRHSRLNNRNGWAAVYVVCRQYEIWVREKLRLFVLDIGRIELQMRLCTCACAFACMCCELIQKYAYATTILYCMNMSKIHAYVFTKVGMIWATLTHSFTFSLFSHNWDTASSPLQKRKKKQNNRDRPDNCLSVLMLFRVGPVHFQYVFVCTNCVVYQYYTINFNHNGTTGLCMHMQEVFECICDHYLKTDEGIKINDKTVSWIKKEFLISDWSFKTPSSD